MSPAPKGPVARAIYAGTSGWAYPTWKPGFYPAGTSAKKFLAFYATQLNSVEVNYTFRTLPTRAMLDGWLASTPADFRFSFKAPQAVTHFKRLRDCEVSVDEFLSALDPVREAGKLGLLLFQLPPNFKADPDRLEAFLQLPALSAKTRPAIAFEFRHDSWFADPIYALLAKSNAALCVAESDDLATPEVHPAAGIACFRLRRNGGYTPAEIAAFATRFQALAEARDVYAYFKHEDEPTGALNGASLLRALGVRG
jgi:uncharacterized protein YecE (DUF72 family)